MGKLCGMDYSGSSDPTSLLRQGHPRAHGTEVHPDGSCTSSTRKTLQPLWAIWAIRSSMCGYLHSKDILPHIQVEIPVHQFLALASCTSGWHHQEVFGPISSAPLLWIFIHIKKVLS